MAASALSRGKMVGIVLAVALLLRLIYLWQIRDNPFFDSPVIDAQYYRDLGAALARGEGTGRAPFMMPPLYPLLLAVSFRVAGVELLLPHVLQLLLGAGAAVLTALLAARLAGTMAGVVAGLFVATSRTLLFLEGDLLATPLAVFLDLVFLLFFLRFLQEGRRRLLLLAGIAGGLSTLAVPLVLVSLGTLGGWLLWRRRISAALLFAAAVALPILPVTAHNLRASGSLVWVSANGGINFYIGNNPDMGRTVSTRPGPAWRRMNDLPLRQEGIVHPAERDRWFYERGLQFWWEQPGKAMRHTLEKATRLLGNHEIMRDFDVDYFAAHYAPLLRWPSWNFAFLLALAAVGWALARRRVQEETALLLFVLSYALGIVAFFVTARYRAPLLPPLALFAALGLSWSWRQTRSRHGSALGKAMLLAAAVGVLSLLASPRGRAVDAAEARYRVGTALQQKGDCAGALQAYREALQQEPTHVLAMTHAAVCEQLEGRPQEAVRLYQTVMELQPDYVDPIVNLANLAWAHGDSAAAARYFELAIRRDPLFAQSHAYYGLFQLAHHAPRRAVELLRRALALDPSWESLRLDLARALVAAGDPQRALQEVESAEHVMGRSDVSELLRGEALLRLGRPAEARAAWERGLRRNPRNRELQERLRDAVQGS